MQELIDGIHNEINDWYKDSKGMTLAEYLVKVSGLGYVASAS